MFSVSGNVANGHSHVMDRVTQRDFRAFLLSMLTTEQIKTKLNLHENLQDGVL